MPELLKIIPREEPEKAQKTAKKSRQKAAKKVHRVSVTKHSPHLQKQESIQLKIENKKIKTVGYKMVNYASSIAKMTQQEMSELIHDAQRSVLYLQKHQRKMLKKKKRNRRS